MTAMDTHVRFELTIPGDIGHVAHRVGDALNALGRQGFRLSARFDGGLVYLLTDHEEPVDSSTVDATSLRMYAPRGFIDVRETCGMAACGHPQNAHELGETHDTGGKCTRPVGPDRMCPCPGWTPITAGIRRAAPGPS